MSMQPTNAAQPMTSTQNQRMSDADFMQRVEKLGKNFRRVQISDNNGRETKETQRVDKAYTEFEEAVKNQSEFMKRASKEQQEVFNEVVQEFTKLRKDGKVDLDRFYKEMEAAVARINEVGGDHNAKASIEHAAAIGMKYSDPSYAKQQKGGVIKQELAYRAEKFFKADKDELESPLFRKIAGLDKHNAGMINPLERARILGEGEAIKKQLTGDITGENEDGTHKGASIAATMGKGQGGGAFPSKIENLHVENLIVKMVRKAEDEKSPRFMQPSIGGPSSGKSAVAVHPLLPGPASGGAHAQHAPLLPAPGEHDHAAAITPKPSHGSPQLEHHEPNLLPPMQVKAKQKVHQDVQDVEFKEHKAEPPIKVKPRNPHAPLKTEEKPIATAVRNAIDVMPSIPQAPTIVNAFKPTNDLKDNDIGTRDSSQTFAEDAPKEDAKPEAKDNSNPLSNLVQGAENALDGLSPRSRTKGGAKPKTKIGKGLATAGKLGKAALKGVASAGGLRLAGEGLDYVGDKLEESGHDQLGVASKIGGKAASWAATGATVGSFIPGVGTAIGAGVGGLAGAADGVYENWDKIDKSWLPEWAGGPKSGKMSGKPNTSGTTLAHAAANHEASKSATNVIVAPQSAPAASGITMPTPVPISSGSRARESYFDRQMMNAFTK